ncbi:MAG TPA: hypothetical protein VFZ61_03385, partial [Polyangiales bacterium]
MQREPTSPRSPRAIVVMLVSLVLLTALDLGTKEWALHNLSAPRRRVTPEQVCQLDAGGRSVQQRRAGAPRSLIPGVLNLYYAEN